VCVCLAGVLHCCSSSESKVLTRVKLPTHTHARTRASVSEQGKRKVLKRLCLGRSAGHEAPDSSAKWEAALPEPLRMEAQRESSRSPWRVAD
jgi:hypothetical protein